MVKVKTANLEVTPAAAIQICGRSKKSRLNIIYRNGDHYFYIVRLLLTRVNSTVLDKNLNII